MRTGRGFTLIELMVVVTIIAILSVVGISLYTTAQKNARDGIRRAELTSLGKSIESSKDPTAARYTYIASQYAADYPQNKPKDPLKASGGPWYCIATDNSVVPDAPTAAQWPSGTCPTGVGTFTYTSLVDDQSAYGTDAANGLVNTAAPAGTAHWRICAKLEVSGAPFCVPSNL